MTEPQRLDELETRLAFQEDTIQQLSEALGSQQLQIARLTETCKALLERSKSLQGMVDELTGDSAPEERPPHY